ncbi:hypothetical protein A3840_04485 [Devosia elaeis]|uniref:Uncharacterized protein n=1 Tax=Devosia elaeis TaxID=1770058 RepID=A0A178I479_9HYPH|nr:hypothetical protein A3840_04485 [Devosia elaeis]
MSGQSTSDAANLLDHAIEALEQRLAPLQHHLSGIGEPDTPRQAEEKFYPQFLFQSRDLAA